MNPIRVLHCPDTVGGNAPVLAAAERALGLASRCVALQPSPYGYPADAFGFRPGDGRLRRELARWRLLVQAFRDYDVIHFNFGSSILLPWVPPDAPTDVDWPRWLRAAYSAYTGLFELRDVAWLRRAGKGICVTFQGDDARQGDWLAAHCAIHPVDEVGPGYYTPAGDAHKRRRIAAFARSAHRIYALNPDLLHVLPAGARFVPYANVNPRDWPNAGVGHAGAGLARPADKVARSADRGAQPTDAMARAAGGSEHPPSGNDRPPVVLHAPSHRGVKGTRFVLAAVERLRADGVPIDFRLVEGVPHAEALRLYREADLLVDQLLVGWYGGLAVELMAMGKPVICYLREADLGFLPPDMRSGLPVIQATPDSIHAVLKTWLTDRRGDLAAAGQAGRAYVARWHDPLRIAGEMRADYAAILGR